MIRFLWGVRRQLAHYRDYIAQLDAGMDGMEAKIAQLESDNARLRLLVDADSTTNAVDARHYKRIINRLNERIDEQEDKIAELESEIEDLEDEYGDDDDCECEEVQYANEELLNTLEEAGLDPARAYSVGELLDIKAALQGVRVA